MIWNSTSAMTAIDVVIVLCALWCLLGMYRVVTNTTEPRLMRGPILAGVGLMLMGAFYGLDLITMLLLPRYTSSREAMDLVSESKSEFDLYKKFKDYYSYGFYIARKL